MSFMPSPLATAKGAVRKRRRASIIKEWSLKTRFEKMQASKIIRLGAPAPSNGEARENAK